MTNEARFSVGLVQTSCGSDFAANAEVTIAGVRRAAERGAQVICLQELFRTPYFCQVEDSRNFDLAETIPGPTTKRFEVLARELDVVLIVPVFERLAPGLFYNSTAVIDASGELLGIYRKMHVPDDPQYYEKFYFTPGDLGYRVFETRFARIGALICWDQWYPEAARLTALGGAELICYPTAIGWLAGDRGTLGSIQHDAWMTVQRGHAIANGVYVAAVNRVGHEPGPSGGLQFWGRSFVCNPQGRVLGEASDSTDDVLVVSCERELMEEQRRNWPFLRDRRIDSYDKMTQRYLDSAVDGDPASR